jgi:hypothetical protein
MRPALAGVEPVSVADDELMLAPLMTGVPAAASEFEGAISMFPDGFSGIMVGGQHIPNRPPAVVVGVLAADGRFVAGVTTRDFAVRLRELLDVTIEAIDRGDFDKPAAAS